MDTQEAYGAYRDRSWLLRAIGALLLLLGLGVAFLAPLEIGVFYWFTEGGRFHYPGFGFGSFMFGNMALQVVGYYLIALICIPLGYGHLRLRRWARTLAVVLLWAWLVVGLPLIVLVFFVLAGSKELTPLGALTAATLLALSYVALPGLFLRFYGDQSVARTFEARDRRSYWTEERPMPILVLAALYAFYLVMLHAPLLFNGIYPGLGTFLYGMPGIILLDVSVLLLALLIWGTLAQHRWAWWGGLVYVGWLTLSWMLALIRSSYAELLVGLRFPARELDFLGGLPVEGYHLALLLGIPLLITWVLIAASRRHFGSQTASSSRA